MILNFKGIKRGAEESIDTAKAIARAQEISRSLAMRTDVSKGPKHYITIDKIFRHL